MKTFAYKGYDAAGRASQGLIEALDLKEAREKLQVRGVLPERVAPVEGAPGGHASRRLAFNLDQRAMCYRELASLLQSGLPLVQALDILIQSPELGSNLARLAGVRDRLREGQGLARALAGNSVEVTAFERSVIEVGERVGTLPEVLLRLAQFLDEQKKLRERILTALLYPAVVLTLAILVAIALLGFLLPWVTRMMQEAGVPLSGLTRGMLGLRAWLGPVVLLTIILGTLGWLRFRRTLQASDEARQRFDQRLLRWPLIGRGYAALINMRFARTLAMLLRGGVPLVEALAIAGRATGSAWTTHGTTLGAERVKHGTSLAATLRTIEPLNTSLPAWVQAGEAGGDLAALLEHAAERYQQQWDRLMTRTMSLIEPALILLVGVFVLLIALAILLPILSMNQTLT
ncbi:MAG: type II secretion system F family protein [Verrucomicrobia bacterium]|nr:MAG: type II secretion system F family protein [Verrucomicrobiota bacterium]